MENIEPAFANPVQNSMSENLKPWIVVFSAALFFFYEFIQMNMFNAIDNDMIQMFNINAYYLGLLSAVYFYANVLFLPPAGMILDRISTKKVIIFTMILSIIGTLLLSQASTYWIAFTCRFATGIGSAFCFLSSMRLASRWFPTKRLAFIIGLVVTMAMTGGMIAQTPLTLLTEAVGWRNALVCDALLGTLFLAIIFYNVQDYPNNFKQEHKEQTVESFGIWESFKGSYLKKQNWLGAIFTCLMNMPISILGVVWGTPYLMQVHKLTHLQASYVTSMLFVGTIIGGPIAGWISDRIGRRKLPMIIGATLSLMLVSTLFTSHYLALSQLMLIFLLLGLVTSAQVISYPTVAESNPIALTATAVSVVSFVTLSGYAIFEPIFGSIIQTGWDGQYFNHVPLYSATQYHQALLILPIGFVIALLASLLIKETHCQRNEA